MSETAPPGYFNVHKYSDPREKAGRKVFVSPSDSIADQAAGHAMSVSFRHEPSGRRVFFKAFISSLNESFSSDWTEEVVYGRTDPIQIFKSTTRRISLGLKVPAESFGEAYDNLGRVAQLTQFLYPNYTQHGSGMYPSQAPMLRLKVMNIIAKSSKDISPAANYSTYKSNADPTGGLLGNITSLTVNHNLETPDVTTFAKDGNTVLPGLIELSIDFVAMHEETLGWDKDKFNDESFPYGVTLMGATAAATELRQLKVDIAKAMAPKIEDPSVALALGKEQQRLAAIKRYGTKTGLFRRNPAKTLNRDIEWLKANAAAYNDGNMTADQMASYEYLKAASDYLMEIGDSGLSHYDEFGMKGDFSFKKVDTLDVLGQPEVVGYTHYEMIDQ